MKLTVLLITAYAVLASGSPIQKALPWIPEPRYNDQGWMDRHNGFVANSLNNAGNIRVIFYGDSITDWWGWVGKETFDQYYAPLGTANYGIAADKSEHILWRIQNGELNSQMNPSVCVIKLGTNNIFDHDEAQIAEGIKANVNGLRQRLPNMKVLLLGILPRNDENLTRKVIAINEIIRHYDNGNTIRFLDMKDHFYRGGNDFVRELYTDDLLHLSALGYRKWAEVMDPLFRQMLG